MHQVQLEAIRKALVGQKIWVGTDEWTSDRGVAIANILVGVSGKVYVVDSVQVPCKGIATSFC